MNPPDNRRKPLAPDRIRKLAATTPKPTFDPIMTQYMANCEHSYVEAVEVHGIGMVPIYCCSFPGVGQMYLGVPHCLRMVLANFEDGLCTHYKDYEGPEEITG